MIATTGAANERFAEPRARKSINPIERSGLFDNLLRTEGCVGEGGEQKCPHTYLKNYNSKSLKLGRYVISFIYFKNL